MPADLFRPVTTEKTFYTGAVPHRPEVERKRRAEADELARQRQPQRELIALRIALGDALCRLVDPAAAELYRCPGPAALARVRATRPFSDAGMEHLTEWVGEGLPVKDGLVAEDALLGWLRNKAMNVMIEYAKAVPPYPHPQRQAALRGPWPTAGEWLGAVCHERDAPEFALPYDRLRKLPAIPAEVPEKWPR